MSQTYLTQSQINSMSIEQLRNKVRDLQKNVRDRGIKIGGLYYALRCAINNPSNIREIESIEDISITEQLELMRLDIIDSGQVPEEEFNMPITCNICYNRYSSRLKPFVISCGHIICIDFLSSIVNNQSSNCPYCRKPIKKVMPLFFN
jgi:hypothetical protein